MPLATRRGFSLAELLVALTLGGAVAAVALRLLSDNLRLYQSQSQVIDRAQNLRAAAVLLTAELRELNASEGDVYSADLTLLSFRAMRRLGFVCAASPAGAQALAIRRQPQFGNRGFDAASDSLLIFFASDSADPEGRWLAAPLMAVRAGACADGAPADVLETSAAGRPVALGAPVRAFEPVTYRVYRGGDGEWHIGLVASGHAIQPLVGPVAANGLELAYYDAAGVRATDRFNIAAIEIRLRVPTARRIRSREGSLTRPVDSIVTVVALRNNLRP